MAQYDSPWKAILDDFFESFAQLCFPDLHTAIDWSRGYQPLDKELQKITPSAAEGAKYVDKLIRVWRTTGEEEWILIHVEVQNQRDSRFAKRMFAYHYRLLARYNREVVSIAVLGDPDAEWQPNQYRKELLGCCVEFTFPIVKLLALADQVKVADLTDESEPVGRLGVNPFLVVVAAHLAAIQTRGEAHSRYASKRAICRALYRWGFPAEQVRKLFLFIDWVLDLPDGLSKQFSSDLSDWEQQMGKPYVTSIERLAEARGIELGIEQGIERGLEQGIERGIESLLRSRFGESGMQVMDEIRTLSDIDLLTEILVHAATLTSPHELRRFWEP